MGIVWLKPVGTRVMFKPSAYLMTSSTSAQGQDDRSGPGIDVRPEQIQLLPHNADHGMESSFDLKKGRWTGPYAASRPDDG